jgi:hypothetical protein
MVIASAYPEPTKWKIDRAISCSKNQARAKLDTPKTKISNSDQTIVKFIKSTTAIPIMSRYASRKEIAAYVTKTICPGCLFSVIDGKSKSVKDFLYGMPVEIEQYIEKYV